MDNPIKTPIPSPDVHVNFTCEHSLEREHNVNITKSDTYSIPIKPKKAVMSKEDIYDLFDRIEEPHTKVLMAILYLTSLRITEALALRRDSFEYHNGVLVVNAINLKSIHVTDKIIPIIPMTEKEKEMVNLIDQYLKGKYIKQRLFEYSRMIAYQYFKKYKVNIRLSGFKRYCKECGEQLLLNRRTYSCSIHGALKKHQMRYERYDIDDYVSVTPHYFRHCRLSHLSDLGLDVTDLMNIAGWVTPNMASIYVRRNIDRTIDKLKSKLKTPSEASS